MPRPRHLPAHFALLAPLIAAIAAAILPAVALAAAPAGAPVYQSHIKDCVTGDNQFYSASDGKFHWYVNQSAHHDGAGAVGVKCDSHGNDRYERPTDQTYESKTITQKPSRLLPSQNFSYLPPASPATTPIDLSGLEPDAESTSGSVFSTKANKYFEYDDITRGRHGVDTTDGWLFFQIELFGEHSVDSALSQADSFATSTDYTVRLATNASANKANGGLALRNEWDKDVPTQWSDDASKVKVFYDKDESVSGATGVDTPGDDAIMTGYEDQLVNDDWLYVRRVPGGVTYNGTPGDVQRPAVEFAFNYKRYNARIDEETAQAEEDQDNAYVARPHILPGDISYAELDATQGLTSEENYLWNDEYSIGQAGSPNPGEGNGTGLGNVYQLDTLSLGALPTARVKVTKDAVPDAAQDFAFGASGGGLSGFSLDDDADATLPNTTGEMDVSGTDPVYISEPGETGWTLTGIVCSGQSYAIGSGTGANFSQGTSGEFQAGENVVKVTPVPGQLVSCTFTNTRQPARLKVTKDAVPDAAQDFAFGASGGGLSGFSLDDDADATLPNTTGEMDVSGTDPVYISEPGETGWTLTGIVCSGQSYAIGSGTGANFSQGTSGEFQTGENVVKVTPVPGQLVSCTFTNTRQPARLKVTKDAVPDAAQDFAFGASGGGLSGFSLDDDADATLPNTTGEMDVSGTDPVYISEPGETGWTLTNIVCSGQSYAIGSGTGANFSQGTSGEFQAGENVVKVTPVPGQLVSCTFTNTRQPARLKVTKDAVPDAAQDFAFGASGGGLSGFSLDDDADATLPNTTGEMDVSGTDPVYISEPGETGWTLTGIVCSGQSYAIGSGTGANFSQGTSGEFQAGENVVKVTPVPGQLVSCTFTNTRQPARLKVTKDAVPDAAQDFAFGASGGGLSGFSLDDDADATLPNTTGEMDVSGTDPVYISEPGETGWTLTGIVCSGQSYAIGSGTGANFSQGTSGEFQTGENVVKVTPVPGQLVSCTFTNTRQPARLKVTKDAVPDAAQDFAFGASGGGLSGFSLDDDADATLPNTTGEMDVSGTDPVYISEPGETGWTLTGIVCSGQSYAIGSGTGANFSQGTSGEFQAGENVVKVTPVPGQLVSCTFTNTRQPARLKVTKDAVPDAAQDFAFGASGGGLSGFSLDDDADATLPNTTGEMDVSGTDPVYISEPAVTGWTLTNIVCSGQSYAIGSGTGANFSQGTNGEFQAGENVVKVTPVPGQLVSCTFTNTRQPARLKVTKDAVPDAAQDFAFGASGGGLSGFSLDDDADATLPSTTGEMDVSGTDPVYISEPAVTGWTLTGIVCSGQSYAIGSGTGANFSQGTDGEFQTGENVVKVTPVPGQLVSCTFTNTRQPARLKVTKDAVPDAAQDFAFGASGGGLNGFSLDDDADATLPNTTGEMDVSGTDPVYISEPAVTGWTLTNIVCSGQSYAIGSGTGANFSQGTSGEFQAGENVVKVTPVPGQLVSCTFTNTRQPDEIPPVESQRSSSTPAVAPAQPIAPTINTAASLRPARRVYRARSRLQGPSGCVAPRVTLSVSGREIRRVEFYLDGKRVGSRSARSAQSRTYRVRVRTSNLRSGLHRVRVKVFFSERSGRRPRNHRLRFQRCQAPPTPRFTG